MILLLCGSLSSPLSTPSPDPPRRTPRLKSHSPKYASMNRLRTENVTAKVFAREHLLHAPLMSLVRFLLSHLVRLVLPYREDIHRLLRGAPDLPLPVDGLSRRFRACSRYLHCDLQRETLRRSLLALTLSCIPILFDGVLMLVFEPPHDDVCQDNSDSSHRRVTPSSN
jgi:hypothetical protein